MHYDPSKITDNYLLLNVCSIPLFVVVTGKMIHRPKAERADCSRSRTGQDFVDLYGTQARSSVNTVKISIQTTNYL